MKITRSGIWLGDITEIGLRDRNGPYLRYTATWKGTTEEDETPALSVPGFRCMMDADREIRIHAPLRRVGPRSTVYSCQISKDLADWMLEALRGHPLFKRIGLNLKNTEPLTESHPDLWGPNAVLLEKCKTVKTAGYLSANPRRSKYASGAKKRYSKRRLILK